MFRTHPILKFSALTLTLLLGGACAHGPAGEEPGKDQGNGSVPAELSPANADQAHQPAIAVATVASLVSVSDVMVREPERFKKVLCSDSNIYDLTYENGRFALAAEPPSVCVLFADTKDLKPIGICGSASCEATTVSDCSEIERNELVKSFAQEQTAQRCWNVGSFAPLSFTVLMTRVGQSCQAQTLAKGPKGWMQLSSIDGTYETRKTAQTEGTGCWWEAGANFSFEGDWFGAEKRVVPIMAFQKEGGLYALLRSSWSGTDNFQLFRFDGDRAVEVESFAESFKDPSPDIEPVLAPVPSVPAKAKAKGKAKTQSKEKVPLKTKAKAQAIENLKEEPAASAGASATPEVPSDSRDTTPDNEGQNPAEDLPPSEDTPEDAPSAADPENAVSPLEAQP